MDLLRTLKKTAALSVAIAFLAACSTPASLTYPAGATLPLKKRVWGAYQEYLAKQGGVRKDGVFLVVLSDNVGVSARWSYCPSSADYCTTGGLNVANQMCVEEHLKCVLFARGPNILVPYKLID